MTLEELARLVAEMRRAQRSYFRNRSTAKLEESKRLERRLDAAVEEVLGQPSLFE
jgi:hypothetical protein